MKIKQPEPVKYKTITVRMPESLLEDVDRKRGVIKRERFIRAILEQVLADKGFVLRLKD